MLGDRGQGGESVHGTGLGAGTSTHLPGINDLDFHLFHTGHDSQPLLAADWRIADPHCLPTRGSRSAGSWRPALADCRSCDGYPDPSHQPGRGPRWMPEFTPDFPDETPDPSHPTTRDRAPTRDGYPDPSHPTTRDQVPERDETPDPSHPTTRDRAPTRDESPNPSRVEPRSRSPGWGRGGRVGACGGRVGACGGR